MFDRRNYSACFFTRIKEYFVNLFYQTKNFIVSQKLEDKKTEKLRFYEGRFFEKLDFL